jgi:hypothetical protein
MTDLGEDSLIKVVLFDDRGNPIRNEILKSDPVFYSLTNFLGGNIDRR